MSGGPSGPSGPTERETVPSEVPVLCTSCGRDDEELAAVHRVYVTPEAWDTPGRVDVQDEVEHWCFACRTQYPHEGV